MSEINKTLAYAALAGVAVIAAVVTRPAPVKVNADSMAGKQLFESFKDPASAKSLKIVRFDQDLGDVKDFEVRQVNGRWVLPSNSNYPADAENTIRDAATQFIGLKAIGLQSNDESSHATYGVLEPNSDSRKGISTEVGTLLEMEDADGKRYRLIVGAPVKDREGQRYVRLPGQGAVYVAQIDLEKFPAKFEQWINRDLLDVNAFDIAKLVLKDYSVETNMMPDGRLGVGYEQRFSLGVHENQGKWSLDELLEFDPSQKQLVPSQLIDGEQLNDQRLNALRDALGELVIVDVERKPEGMRSDLTADADFTNRRESVQSLIERGFYPVPMPPDGKIELLSSDGEVVVQMKDGLEYVLRFGGVTGTGNQVDGDAKLNRYLFVSARVNKDLIPQPELEQVPELPGQAADAKFPDAAAPGGAAPPAAGGDTTAPATEAPASESPAAEAPAAEAPAAEAPATEAPAAEAPATEAPAVEAPAEGSPPPGNGSSNDGNVAESLRTKPVVAQAEPAVPAAPTTPATPAATAQPPVAASPSGGQPAAGGEAADRLEAERARIVKENQRKMDEYNEKLAQAETKKNDVNFRFADWYYVISEDVYKKIHLSRADVIKGADKASGGVGEARDLLDQGLEGGLEGVPTEPPSGAPTE
ncbi:MAG: DUF4340 domain-containing protein [Pirellulales bacterium]